MKSHRNDVVSRVTTPRPFLLPRKKGNERTNTTLHSLILNSNQFPQNRTHFASHHNSKETGFDGASSGSAASGIEHALMEHSPRHFDASETHALELVDFPSGDTDASSSTEIEHIPSNRIHLTSVESSNASTSAPPHMHDEITRSSGSSALIESNRTGQSRISIFQSLIDRARRTVRGSADDIGWLQRDPGMPPVEDGTERFLEILDNIKHGVHKLPNSVVYLLIPGKVTDYVYDQVNHD
ncbi:hypothetical protein GmHk_03G007712 [Glycine max]|nr:hypothetical protein GmHk_03G007712 [Glycine max]